MKFELFEEQARLVLQHQDGAKVDCFIDACKLLASEELPDADLEYLPEKKIKPYEATLKHLQKIKVLDCNIIDAVVLDKAIKQAEYRLSLNEVLKTHGAPSGLSYGDVYRLTYLKIKFAEFLPGLSANFVKGNVLYQLGESLIEKNMPETATRFTNNLLLHLLRTQTKSTRAKIHVHH